MSHENYSDEDNILSLLNEEEEEISLEEQMEIAEGVLSYCTDLFNKKLPENYRDESVAKYIPLFAVLYETAKSSKTGTIALNLEKLVSLIAPKNTQALKAYVKRFGKDVVRIMCDIVNEINREPSKAPKPEIVKQLIEISAKHKADLQGKSPQTPTR